jgi:hypothetical protein
MKKSKLALIVTAVLLSVPLFAVLPAYSEGGVTLAPAIKEVLLSESEQSVDFTFSLTNTSAQPLTFRLSAIDFGALDETGGVSFISKSSDGFATKYGLKQWIRLSTDSIVLQPGEKKESRAIIDNKESLSPGGHYGAILATPIDTDLPENENTVAISPSLSVLIFLKKQGGENYSMGLQEPVISKFSWSLPKSLDLRFQNTGNVHVVPRGTVTIRSSRGNDVSRAIINQDSVAILPESFRSLKTELRQTSRAWLPGSYTLEASWRYDGSDEVQETVVEFYYLGNILYLGIGIICIVLICIVVIRSIKRR